MDARSYCRNKAAFSDISGGRCLRIMKTTEREEGVSLQKNIDLSE